MALSTTVGVPLGEVPSDSEADGVPVGLADSEGVEVWLAQALPDAVGEDVTLALAPGLSVAVGVGEAEAVTLALAGTLAPPAAEAGAGPVLELAGVSDAPGETAAAAL